MTDYQRQQVSLADKGRPRVSFPQFIIYHILNFSFRDTETTGWRSGTPGNRVRRQYSESEEYDRDSDTDRDESSRVIKSTRSREILPSLISDSIFKASQEKNVQNVYLPLTSIDKC